MVEPPRHTRRGARLCAAAFLASLVCAAEVRGDAQEAQLERLRARIERLQRELNEAVGKRDTVREQLQTEERRIDELMRALRETDAKLARQTRALEELKRREQRERAARREQLAALEAQIRAAYVVGREPYLKILLNQEKPAAAARVLAYYRYFNAARVARIDEAESALGRLQDLEAETRAQASELGRLREGQHRERSALEQSRRERAELLAHLNRQVANRTDAIERLRGDEQRLERLVRELKDALPDLGAPFPGGNETFASLKGRLPLPLAGRISARYGQPKGVGNLTWRGIFVSGKEGQTVRAVSRGRVAFADWLRGFGLLLILDHGDGYMTLYGHNETLIRRAGDWVEAGQPIAAAGNSGDAPGTGVYFEIRHNGVPSDPLQWCATGRTAPVRVRR